MEPFKLWSHSRSVVCFNKARELPRHALPVQRGIPDTCAKGIRYA